MARNKRNRRSREGNWFTRRSLGGKIGIVSGFVLIFSLITGVSYAALKISKIDTQPVEKKDIVINEEVEEKLEDLGTGFLTVAIFGGDSRTGEMGAGVNSDCIIVAALNKDTKEVKMVSVYRDTLLDIGDGTLRKCNAAFAQGGPEQAISMLNRNMDIKIDHYVSVDFGAVAEVIDLLGGVEINIEEMEVPHVNRYLEETARVAGKPAIFLTHGGVQLLDGVQATTYARVRSTAGHDFKRTERQRIVIEKMVEKMKQSDLITLNSVIDAVFPRIKTSFTTTDILFYAQFFLEYKLGASDGFPFDKTTDTYDELGAICIPTSLESNVPMLHEFLYGTIGYTPSSVVRGISDSIISLLGNMSPMGEEELYNQPGEFEEDDTYDEEDTAEDQDTEVNDNDDNIEDEPTEPTLEEPIPEGPTEPTPTEPPVEQEGTTE